MSVVKLLNSWNFNTRCEWWDDPNQPGVFFFSRTKMALNQALQHILQPEVGSDVLVRLEDSQVILRIPQDGEKSGDPVLRSFDKKSRTGDWITYLCLEPSDEKTPMPWAKPNKSFKAEELGQGLRQARFSTEPTRSVI